MDDEVFEDAEPGVVSTHPVDDNLIRTNVQGWIAEQDALQGERLAKYDRENYYSILSGLYEQVNPVIAGSLIREVRQWSPPMEWLDHAVVVVTALQREHPSH